MLPYSTNGKALPLPHKNQQHPQFLYSLWRRANARVTSELRGLGTVKKRSPSSCQNVYQLPLKQNLIYPNSKEKIFSFFFLICNLTEHHWYCAIKWSSGMSLSTKHFYCSLSIFSSQCLQLLLQLPLWYFNNSKTLICAHLFFLA